MATDQRESLIATPSGWSSTKWVLILVNLPLLKHETLQVLSGHHPFYDIASGPLIVNAIIEGVRPAKPDDAARLGFNDELWKIVEQCWREKRAERPSVEDIRSCLNDATAFWYMREF